jgi:hypothetical protein
LIHFSGRKKKLEAIYLRISQHKHTEWRPPSPGYLGVYTAARKWLCYLLPVERRWGMLCFASQGCWKPSLYRALLRLPLR